MTAAAGWRRWGLLAATAAVVGWLAAPDIEPSASVVKPRRDTWHLSELPRRVDQTSLTAMVMSAPYWGAPVAREAAASAAPEDPRWRIAAVYGRGAERGVLVEFAAAGKPPLRLKPGDKLPSGHRITNIGEREVCIEIGKRSYRLGVERSGV